MPASALWPRGPAPVVRWQLLVVEPSSLPASSPCQASIQIPRVGGVERKRSPGQLELVISLEFISEQKSE